MASAADPILEHVLPMRIVVRNRVMSLRSSVNGESGPSWSEISRTFHGQSVVIAVSEMQKNAYTNRSTTVPMTAPELSVFAIAVAVPAAAAAVSAAARFAKAGPPAANVAAAAAAARRAAEKRRRPPSGKTTASQGRRRRLRCRRFVRARGRRDETDRVTSDSRGETPPPPMAGPRPKTTPPQPPLTYAPKNIPEKVHVRVVPVAATPGRGEAREGARARRRDRVGCAAP